MCGNSNLLIIVFILGLIIVGLIFFYKRNAIVDSFDNLEHNLYSYDTCCSQQEIAHCQTYGKTGVCNYYQNNKSCLCQNAF
jgi:hypothetical protein